MQLPEKGYKRILVLSVYLFFIAIGIILFYKYLLSPLLAFITAFSIVCLTRPIISSLHKILGISKKLTVILFNISLICIIGFIVYLAFTRLLSEIIQFSNYISSDKFSSILDGFSNSFDNFLQKFSDIRFLSLISQKGKFIDDIVISITKEFTPFLVQYLMAFFKFIPNAIIFIILVFISMFYIGCDYENIIAFICAQLSPKAQITLKQIKKQFVEVCADLFKAYFLITLLTFAQLLTGFIILDIKYAAVFALIISLVDMLPILGTGTVLIPWAIVCLIIENNTTAIGLLVIYAIITIVRQIAEPKIIGASIGLYPLVTLISMYCGLKIMGFAGLFVFPIAAMIIKNLNDKGIIHLYNDPKPTGLQKIQQSKKKFMHFHNKDSNQH